MKRYFKIEGKGWFWHKDEYTAIGPFSSRKATKNDYAKYCEQNKKPQIIGRIGGSSC